MAFDEFDYERKWTDPEDFPTYEYDEGTVRADMQALFDEIRDAFNDFATQADTDIEDLKEAIQDIVAGSVPPGSVTAVELADGSVTTPKLAEQAVTAVKIATSAVTADKIKPGNVTAAKIAAYAVTPGKLAADAVITTKIKDGNVTEAKIANSAVTKDKIAADAVITAKIKDQNVTTAKLANLGVTTAKIATGAVTREKLADDVISDILDDQPVTGDQIAIGAVSWVYPEILEVNDWRAVTVTTYVNQGGQGEGQVSIGGQSTTITYYVLEISEPTIKATDRPIVDVSLPLYSRDAAEEKMEEWSKVAKVETSNGKIIFSAYEKPNTDFGVNVLVLRR